MFKEVPAQFDFPAAEREVLAFWEANDIYRKSLERRRGAPQFVFYEGPPTANGLPHPGHCLTRTIKDIFPRYRTMTGYCCERKAGWDTHGLPVEAEVCKELGIHTKQDIEQYGVEKFIQLCQKSVFRYMKEWEELTKRIGFWVDLNQAYVTYHQSYVESVWWALKMLFDRGLLYQGHKIVWWWPQGGTALSSGEVGQGYREVDDPSITIRFRLKADSVAAAPRGGRGGQDARPPEEHRRDAGATPVSFLAWTTTPWTLSSNVGLAVHPDVDYVQIAVENEEFILAKDLVASVFKGLPIKPEDIRTVHTFKGSELVGLQYEPIFNYAMPENGRAWEVVAADFVTLDTGTGIVHMAPAFGEDDFRIAREKGLGFLQLVAPDGTFVPAVTDFAGRNCKEADADIIRLLKDRGVLLKREQYRHEYPFCWRAEEDPLIQYARKSWFVRTTQFRDEFLKNNAQINWLPEHIRTGRFGNFLENNVDWALSRERFWGTPLPIWQCEQTEKQEAVASYAELTKKPGVAGEEVWEEAKRRNPDLVDDLRVHKPYIDAVTYDSPFAAGARMRRVPEVIDCWFDSGAMPFAQWGYPHKPGSDQLFSTRFPADFISEAIDQTRGWFYTLLAISTILIGPKLDGTTTRTSDMPPISQLRGRPLGRILIKMGRVDRTQVTAALEIQKKEGEKHRPIGQILVSLGYIAEPDVKSALTAQGRMDNVDWTFPELYPHPFRNCIVMGIMAGEDGKKLSKSKRNYKEPSYIFDKEGADAMRWSMLANQPPWTGARFKEETIATDQREFLIKLYNVYSFFVIYANIDRWSPADFATGAGEASELDSWILTELHSTINDVRAAMDRYENYPACRRLVEFVDALSNWYVRRSRERFWRAGMDNDKQTGYFTLWYCLVNTSKLIAPFTPFFAETLYQNLVRSQSTQADESVHLCNYPQAEVMTAEQRKLLEEMSIVREIASLGRAARAEAKLKVRQPLSVVELVLADLSHCAWLESHLPLIQDELNVKRVEFTADADKYVRYEIKPNFKSLGPKFGPLAPKIKAALAKADAADLRRQLEGGTAARSTAFQAVDPGQDARATPVARLQVDGQIIELTPGDVQVALAAKPGWAAAQGRQVVVVLSTELTPELKAEGLARDFVHLVQQARKEERLDYQDRIRLHVHAEGPAAQAIESFREYIMGETLAAELSFDGPVDAKHAGDIESSRVAFSIEIVK